jgi:undecaprenyl-phosphate galactose phosphotransferase
MRYPSYKFLLAVVDFLLVRAAISVALQMRGISHVTAATWSQYLLSPEFYFFFVYSLIVVLIFQNYGLYKIHIALTRSRQIVALAQSFLYAGLVLGAFAFFLRSPWVVDSRLALLYFCWIAFTATVAFRVFVFRPLYISFARKNIIRKNILIVGSNHEAKTLAIRIQHDTFYGIKLLGFVDDEKPLGTPVYEQATVVGRIDDIPRLVREKAIREVVITVSEVGYDRFLQIVDICKRAGAAVTVSSALFNVIHSKADRETYFDIPIARLGDPRKPWMLLAFKRAFDVIAAVAGLLVLAIPLAIIAILIKTTSKGPIFYRQTRLGKDGRPFAFYKFRSMYVDSDKDAGRVERVQEFIKGKSNGDGSTKVVNERMITPIGRLLRKTSIDELPQLFNVLKGEMSLVGPRPCLPYEYEVYEEWHKRRLSVIPGCTGLWQVSSRSEVGFDEMVLLDLYYIDNQSPWLDLQLILKTIPVMLFGRGGK